MTAPRVVGSNPSDPWPVVNEALDILAHQEVYGIDPDTTAGLTLGLLGGRWGGFSYTTGTLTLTNTAENYVVVKLSDGVPSVSTATTNWNNLAEYTRAYHITMAGGVPTTIRDYRAGPGGVHGRSDPSATAQTQSIIIAVGDESTALTTGTSKVTFRMPYGFSLSGVRSSVKDAPTGANLVVDINEGGVSILSTKLSIDAGEKTSTTAATPAVISDATLADDAEITIDIDQVGSTVAGAGLKVVLIGTKT